MFNHTEGRYFGERYIGNKQMVDAARDREASLAKDMGLYGNFRNGPNPYKHMDMIAGPGTWYNLDSAGVNAWQMNAMGALNADVFELVGDGSGNHFLRPKGGQALGGGSPLERLAKADDILNTGADAAIFNFIFGAIVTAQTAQQQNAQAALGRSGYPHGGFRAKTAAAITSGVGVAEASTAGDAAHPTYYEVSVGLKEHHHNVALSRRMELMVGADDVITWTDTVLQDGITEFLTSFDADLLQDCDTTANLNAESLDRLTATDTGAVTNHGYDAGDTNIYSLNKASGQTWFNPYMNENSNVNRSLTGAIVDSTIENAWQYWSTANYGKSWRNKMFITGMDTWGAWKRLEEAGLRYAMGEQSVITLPGGLQELAGAAGGYGLTSYMQIPIVLDEHVPDDGGKRIYLIDNDVVKICQAQPMTITEGDHAVYLGHYRKANIYMVAELKATRGRGNASVWDLTP